MTIKELKGIIELFRDNDSAIEVIKKCLSIATIYESEIALQSAFDRLKVLAFEQKNKCMNLERQLIMTKMYLKGEMYTDEKIAREMLDKQILNIEKVLENDN